MKMKKNLRGQSSDFLQNNLVPLMFIIICAICIPLSDFSPSYLLNEIVTRMGRNIFLILSLLIPIMAASVMAACSFVGEKEKRTLETLLYCPLSLKQIFRAKVLAAFLLSMLVSAISFAVMLIVLETETCLLAGFFLLPDAKWLLILLLVSPAVSLIAITLIVKTSAKAQSVEDAQQGAVFLLFPVLMLLVGQFTGVLLINAWLLLVIGIVCALLAVLLLKQSMSHFKYETLLK